VGIFHSKEKPMNTPEEDHEHGRHGSGGTEGEKLGGPA